MDERKSQERKAFLAEVEDNFQRGDFETILMIAGLRLKRMPGDLDARLAVCRARIEQGALDEAGDLLAEIERILAGLDKVYASLRDLGLKTGLTEETRALFKKFGLAVPAESSTEIAADQPGRSDRREIEAATGAGIGTAETPAERMSPDEDVPRVEESADESPETPEDFHTVTLAELYLRQGHLRLAERVLEKILRQEPRNEKATELLREVRDRLQPEGSVQRQAAVKAELSRWLDNIARMRGHAT